MARSTHKSFTYSESDVHHDLRDRKHVGRVSRGGGKNDHRGRIAVSKHFVVFVCAGLTFFGLSVLSAGRSNRAFERHFQEIAKVRADRRKLREENEVLARENAKLRSRLGGYGPDDSGYSDSHDRQSGYDGYQPSLVQEVSVSAGNASGRKIIPHGFQG
jgi:hypothetical protein